MNRIGRAVLGDTELLSVDEIVQRVEAVTAGQIAAIARDHWDPDSLSGAAIGGSPEVIEEGARRLSPAMASAIAAPARA